MIKSAVVLLLKRKRGILMAKNFLKKVVSVCSAATVALGMSSFIPAKTSAK